MSSSLSSSAVGPGGRPLGITISSSSGKVLFHEEELYEMQDQPSSVSSSLQTSPGSGANLSGKHNANR